jgi:hypothetical protein
MVRQLDSKKLDIENAEFQVCYITMHCIERILRRSRAQNLKECLDILRPTINALMKLSLLTMYIEGLYKYILYWQEGYLVLEAHDHQFTILTWLPKDWFTDQQFVKLYNFSGNGFYLFDETIFNSKNVLSATDAIVKL